MLTIKKVSFFTIIAISCLILFVAKIVLSLLLNHINYNNIANLASYDNSHIDKIENDIAKDISNNINKESDEPKLNDDNIKNLSQSEFNMLNNLRKRHKYLLSFKKKLIDKENLLQMIKSNINEKIKELEKRKKEIKEIISEYKNIENKKRSGVMKIYENMKPQEAAQIFEELDIDTLMPVIQQMQEIKLAPIMARMKVNKVKEITMLLVKPIITKDLQEECFCK